MRYFVNEIDGIKTPQSWDKQDYIDAILAIELSITQRMRDEAILGTSTLLAEKRAQIDVLRNEMIGV